MSRVKLSDGWWFAIIVVMWVVLTAVQSFQPDAPPIHNHTQE